MEYSDCEVFMMKMIYLYVSSLLNMLRHFHLAKKQIQFFYFFIFLGADDLNSALEDLIKESFNLEKAKFISFKTQKIRKCFKQLCQQKGGKFLSL
jgi:hypothetical protein